MPAVTVKVPVTTSPPVVNVTVCAPAVADADTVTFTVALVKLLTTTEFTVMPPVIPAVVVPFAKCVPLPVTTNETAPNPCGSEEGAMELIDALLALTVKLA